MSNTLKGIRIARVSTIPFFVFTQLRSQLEGLAAAEAEVTIVSSQEDSDCLQTIVGCNFKPVYIPREISLFTDFKALLDLIRLFRAERFDIVHSTTPKAGLLCAIAAKLAKVPICIHTFTGQTWVTMSGFKRRLVQWSDWLVARLNQISYTDSFSQRDYLIKNKIVSGDKIKVIGSGSLAGVDTIRFSLNRFSELDKAHLKASLGISPNTKIILFVGRITREKGVFELFEAVKRLSQDVMLLMIGPFEQNNEKQIRASAKICSEKIQFLGFQAEPERYMAIADLLCLPSYREGFGTVVIEAALMGVPTVGSNIYGLSDSIVDGVTGMLVEPRNSSQLAEVIEKLLIDDGLRNKFSKQARERALKEFDGIYFNELLQQEYIYLLNTFAKKV